MKNTLKKLGAIALVLMLMLSLSVTAFAAEDMTASGIVGSKDSNLNSVLKIPKTLKVFNPDEESVYAPNISYSYAVTAGTAEIEITDADEVTAKTKAPTSAQMPTLTASTLSWSSASTTLGASSTGNNSAAANVQYLELTFTPSAFTAAGIYRYKITETVTYTGTGVTEGENTDHELFLDVYVKDTNANTAGQTIYGYVLHTGDDSINGSTSTNTDTKVEGFVYDEYHTSNLTVSKTLVNDAAMNSHEFPMAVTIAEGSVSAGFHLLTEKTGTATVAATLADKTYTDSAKVANGGTVKYVGLPTGATFTVTETNDVTGTTYKVTHAIDGGTSTEDGNKYTGGTATAAVTTVAADSAHTVAFTNELVLISPTGVVMRVAPYALMLIGGFVLLVISRRRKVEEA